MVQTPRTQDALRSDSSDANSGSSAAGSKSSAVAGGSDGGVGQGSQAVGRCPSTEEVDAFEAGERWGVWDDPGCSSGCYDPDPGPTRPHCWKRLSRNSSREGGNGGEAAAWAEVIEAAAEMEAELEAEMEHAESVARGVNQQTATDAMPLLFFSPCPAPL